MSCVLGLDVQLGRASCVSRMNMQLGRASCVLGLDMQLDGGQGQVVVVGHELRV